MSFVTACPACATCFRVQPEQLAERQGKVRCGKCGEAFDALTRLAAEQQSGQAAAPTGQPLAEPEENPSPYTYTIVDKPGDSPPSPPEPVLINDDPAPVFELPPPVAAQRRWPTPALLTALILLACLQTVFYLRTPIAAHWPATQPYLLAACDTLGCQVPLPRHADLLAIDDSDLKEDVEYQGLLHFSGIIVNKAAFTQAYPLLELTLTDVGDQPLLRRTFKPQEYLPAGTDVNAGLAAQEEIRIAIALSAGDTPLAGYRAFIMYPAL